MENNINKDSKSINQRTLKRKFNFLLVLMIIIVIIVSSIFGAIFGFVAGRISRNGFSSASLTNLFNNSQDIKKVDVIKQQIIEDDSAVIEVVEKSSPAVVSIIISNDVPKMQKFFSNPYNFPDFFGQGFDPFGSGDNSGQAEDGAIQKQKIGGGSGFIITADGMIVTNRHVASDTAADYTVITNDGKERPAKVLALDPVNDMAVIKIDGHDYPTLNLGDSDSLKIGQTVVAIGNSLGEFSNTVNRGIVSGLKRNLTASGGRGESERLSNIIQTDAAINPGNSGGPLLNINGDVIGINVAMAQGAQNIGFAIPANQIKKVVEQVKETGKIVVPYLGVRYVPMDDQIKQIINSPYDYGVLVVRGNIVTDFAVVPGSPADKAGIVENDVILEINGIKLDEDNGLSDLISKNSVGDTIKLKIWHKGEIKEIQVKLTERQ
ncbi:MAG: hypothetical protein COX30_00335 [Candidatus Moranbacteria bacterium CG23_combo_of_CG06-09_8_20_14_all_39_10]|nr:MAG: hypothetical protein COX30_00335 [Candidatus Moranbacteria bacterium CG23_combo_of_CG06-09_8_20_14_all_39_10]